VCAVLHVITFSLAFTLSPECAHLFPNTCKLLCICLHRIFRCLSSYCIPYAIIKCQMTMLINYFPGLAARFFPPENCLIHLLAPLLVYLRILNSLILQNVGSFIRWFSSMRFHFDQEGCCPCGNLFVSMRMAAAQILRQVPPLMLPFYLH